MKKRVREIEDGISERYGVTIRQEKTIVKVEFSRLELTCFMRGLLLLSNNAKVMEDIGEYFAMYKKIEKMISNVEKEV